MADADDTNVHPSADDALEPPDDIYNPAIDEERLEEDNDPPAAPAKPSAPGTRLPPDHPEFDYDLDAHEIYDEGELSATDVDAAEEVAPAEEAWPLEEST